MQNTTDSRADELLKDLASDYANYLITDTPTEVYYEIIDISKRQIYCNNVIFF